VQVVRSGPNHPQDIPMSSEKTLAIVLRVVEFSESSYVTTLFTEDFGKITALAKGARRPKSAFENALDLLAVSRVVFIRKSSDAMDLLTEARLERRFRAGLRDLRRLYAGFYVVELLQSLTDERDPHPQLFRHSLQTLASLDDDAEVADALLRFELSILRELGHLPALDTCVECGRAIPTGGRVAFGQVAGGALCANCKTGQRHVVSLSAGAMELLRNRLTPSTTGTVHQSESESESVRGARGELRGLMNHRISHLLGRRPRMHAFLASLRREGTF
jgi:DNA repair protein RecO (recombination protein O)